MSSTPSLGDAVRSDGTLKDAAEILWSYDADETIPFPSDGNSGHCSSSGRHAPATADTAQAVRRTSRVIRPCRRFCEEDKAESASSAIAQKSSGVKRKATSDPPGHCATRKNIVNIVSDNSSDDRARSPSPLPTEPASDDYDTLQGMADTDNQVCSTHLSI
jgi:hypothetical protein